jgi:hypothetical protein
MENLQPIKTIQSINDRPFFITQGGNHEIDLALYNRFIVNVPNNVWVTLMIDITRLNGTAIFQNLTPNRNGIKIVEKNNININRGGVSLASHHTHSGLATPCGSFKLFRNASTVANEQSLIFDEYLGEEYFEEQMVNVGAATDYSFFMPNYWAFVTASTNYTRVEMWYEVVQRFWQPLDRQWWRLVSASGGGNAVIRITDFPTDHYLHPTLGAGRGKVRLYVKR